MTATAECNATPRARALTRNQRIIAACRLGRGDRQEDIARDLGVWPDRVSYVAVKLRQLDPSLLEPKTNAKLPEPAPLPAGRLPAPVTIAELCDRAEAWARLYYRRDGKPTREHYNTRDALKPLRAVAGDKTLDALDAVTFYAAREWSVTAGLARRTINSRMKRLRTVMRWAARPPQRWIPPAVVTEAELVEPLKRGRTEAPERPKVKPVTWADVEAALPHMSRLVAAMVKVQWHCGCRPGEIVIMRPMDIDRTGDVWLYMPERHKCEHHDRPRVIPLGPRAQDVLRNLIEETPPGDYIFQPLNAKRDMDARRASKGKPRRPGQKPNPRMSGRRVRDHYDTGSYGTAVRRACWQAGINVWSPNRLRHSAATRLRAATGELETVRVVLGHSTTTTSEIYAEKDTMKAVEVMAQHG